MKKFVYTIGKIILISSLIFLFNNAGAQDGNDLRTAVTYQDLVKVKELVEAGVDINDQDESYGTTALMMACQYNLVDIAKYLIEKGADISIQSNSGQTALMASASASQELFNLLIANGADFSVKDNSGYSAFTLSITGVLMERVGLEIAGKLLELGADVNEAATSGAAAGYTCLMMAARNQRPDIANFLIEHGANVNAKAADGSTALSLAEKKGDQEMVALLKKHGAK
jgi:ankyrin repeat protein